PAAPWKEACGIVFPLQFCSLCPLAQWERGRKNCLRSSCMISTRQFARQLERPGRAAAIHEGQERAFSKTPIVGVFSGDSATGRLPKQEAITKFNLKRPRVLN